MATIETAYYVPTLLGLSTTFGISCAITAGCVLGFEICRRRDSMQCLFGPRTRLVTNAAAPLSKRPFAWLSTFWLDEAYFLAKVGLDATMYLRFLRMTVQFLTTQALIVCPILLALHWTGGASNLDWRAEKLSIEAKDHLGGGASNVTVMDQFRSSSTLYYLSIANVPDGSSIVWIHVFLTFSVSLTWLWLLFVNQWHHLGLQQAASDSDNMSGIHERSILITNVPPAMRNTDSLCRHFASQFAANVETTTIVKRTLDQTLRKALVKREKRLDQLETRLIVLARTSVPGAADEVWSGLAARLDALGMKCDDVVELIEDITTLDREIEHLRADPNYYQPTSSVFVTFDSPHSAQICSQVVTPWNPGVFNTRMAPEPRDILWRSLLRSGRRDRLTGRIRQWVVFAAVWSLTIFWLFPISFILGLTSIESLSQHFGFVRYFLDTSIVVRSFIQNILPTLLVTLFMSLLPWILLEISKQQDFASYSELEDCVLGRYYHFAIFNVLIVFLLGTTFLSTMLDVLYEPAKLIQLLANSLPQGANFFLNYILFNSSTHAMELVQLGSQLFGHLFVTLPCISRTPRILRRLTLPWSFPYYYYYPNHILVLVITLTYSVIQPLILIFALFYFTLALVCYRHQFAYCYVRRYESGGSRHYRRMARYTSDGLIIFQLTTIGLLYLKGVLAAATALFPLIVITVWCKIKLARLFGRRAKYPFLSRMSSHTKSTTPSTDHETKDTRRMEQKIGPGRDDSYWWYWIDDIWKLSYVRAWWVHGRYATQSDMEVVCRVKTDMSSVVELHTKTEASPQESDCSDQEKSLTSALIDGYDDDSISTFETYERPTVSRSLDKCLLLPLDPSRRRWQLKDCVRVPLWIFERTFCQDPSSLEIGNRVGEPLE